MSGNRLRSPVADRIEVSELTIVIAKRSGTGSARASARPPIRTSASERDDVVEDHEPRPAVAIQERARDRRDEDAREHAGDGDQPGERRRVVLLEREQDERRRRPSPGRSGQLIDARIRLQARERSSRAR